MVGEDDNDQVTVRYYGYPDVETRAKSDLKPLPPASLDPSTVTVGTECQVRPDRMLPVHPQKRDSLASKRKRASVVVHVDGCLCVCVRV